MSGERDFSPPMTFSQDALTRRVTMHGKDGTRPPSPPRDWPDQVPFLDAATRAMLEAFVVGTRTDWEPHPAVAREVLGMLEQLLAGADPRSVFDSTLGFSSQSDRDRRIVSLYRELAQFTDSTDADIYALISETHHLSEKSVERIVGTWKKLTGLTKKDIRQPR